VIISGSAELAPNGTASELPPKEQSFEGMNPSQIEKILIEQLLAKPKNSKKEAFSFEKTVKPILESFKKQLLEDKKKMQKQLDADIKAVKACISKMKKSTKLGLLEETEVNGKNKKCPTKAAVKRCDDKIKKLKPTQKACKDLQGIGKKDVDSIMELVKKWNKQKVFKKDCKIDKGETKFHYVKRLHSHFLKKLKTFEKQLNELSKKKLKGKKLAKGCNAIQHYGRRLVQKTCAKIKGAAYGCRCQSVITEQKVCKMFDGCYTGTVTAYTNNEKEIRKKNAAAKLEWRAVGRIECLLKVMGGKQKADKKQLDKCITGPQISTRPLDLKYYKIPPKPKCALKGLTPQVRKMCKQGAQKKK